MKSYIPRIMTFASYGLNKYRNNLCRINMQNIKSKSLANMFDIVGAMLFDSDCDNCAIFMHSLDDSMYAAIKIWDNDAEDFRVDYIKNPVRSQYDYFSAIDGDYKLCCYGLVVEVNNNEWRIVDA